MLKVVNLGVSIGRIQIVRNAAIDLREGEMCGLIGRNGAGKTTFLRALMGAVPATGKAELVHELGPVDLLALPAHRRVGLGIGYMPEDRRLVPEFTVEQNIRLPTWTTAVDDVEQRLTWIFSIMPEVAGFRSRRAVELSGGQQKMAALARALMAGRRMLLLDEPFEGLAPALALRLGEVMSSLKGEGISILVAESNESHISKVISRAFRIERGMVSAC